MERVTLPAPAVGTMWNDPTCGRRLRAIGTDDTHVIAEVGTSRAGPFARMRTTRILRRDWPRRMEPLPDGPVVDVDAALAQVAAETGETIETVRNVFDAIGACAEEEHIEAAADGPDPLRCPRCGSPARHLHPATQHEGEAQPCPHPWHTPEVAA